MSKPICIVESPYAGDTKRNLAYLLRCFEFCFDSGYLPIASHSMFTSVLDDALPDQRKRGIEWGYEYWQCAEVVIFFCDYEMSPGMEAAWSRVMATNLLAIQVLIGENP